MTPVITKYAKYFPAGDWHFIVKTSISITASRFEIFVLVIYRLHEVINAHQYIMGRATNKSRGDNKIRIANPGLAFI